jgi:hypothetical protein
VLGSIDIVPKGWQCQSPEFIKQSVRLLMLSNRNCFGNSCIVMSNCSAQREGQLGIAEKKKCQPSFKFSQQPGVILFYSLK